MLISGSLPPMKCGVGDYTASLATALKRQKDTVVAVITDESAVPIPSDFSFEVLPIARGWRMKDLSRLLRTIRRWNPDIIHIQYPTQGYGRRYLPWLLPIFLGLLKLPIVQTWHEYHLEKAIRNIFNTVMAGGLIAVRPQYKETMSSWYRWLIRRKRFEFIPNASAIPKRTMSDFQRTAEKSRFASTGFNLIVYFGFAHAAKSVELLFDIADPDCDYLFLACELDPKDAYHKAILDRASEHPWANKVTVAGFLPAAEVATVLAAADAVVLPFRDGGGEWNTSIHAAVLQGTFVLTTSRNRRGYDASQNTYYASPTDLIDMRSALRTFCGKKVHPGDSDLVTEWKKIADAHLSFYSSLLSTF